MSKKFHWFYNCQYYKIRQNFLDVLYVYTKQILHKYLEQEINKHLVLKFKIDKLFLRFFFAIFFAIHRSPNSKILNKNI